MHTLLIVENDGPLLQRLARAMEMRGFRVTTAASVADGLAQIRLDAPAYAVVDLRLDDGCGLDVIFRAQAATARCARYRSAGYGNIATAVGAVKLGAIDYLTKPADADVVFSALLAPDVHWHSRQQKPHDGLSMRGVSPLSPPAPLLSFLMQSASARLPDWTPPGCGRRAHEGFRSWGEIC